MTDVMTVAKRSALMARIRSHGNKSTELQLARLLRASGVTGWRRHVAVVGRPDFVFKREKVAVFVDGCFWHGCPKHFVAPKNRAEFWRSKIERNRSRDRSVGAKLRCAGWTVIRIWEHDLAGGAVQNIPQHILAEVESRRSMAR